MWRVRPTCQSEVWKACRYLDDESRSMIQLCWPIFWPALTFQLSVAWWTNKIKQNEKIQHDDAVLFFSHNNLRLDSRLMVAMTIYQQIVSFYRLKTSTAIIFDLDFRWKFSLNYSARVHSITLFQFTWKPVALKICEKRHDTHGTGRLGSPDGTNGVTVAFPFCQVSPVSPSADT